MKSESVNVDVVVLDIIQSYLLAIKLDWIGIYLLYAQLMSETLY